MCRVCCMAFILGRCHAKICRVVLLAGKKPAGQQKAARWAALCAGKVRSGAGRGGFLPTILAAAWRLVRRLLTRRAAIGPMLLALFLFFQLALLGQFALPLFE